MHMTNRTTNRMQRSSAGTTHSQLGALPMRDARDALSALAALTALTAAAALAPTAAHAVSINVVDRNASLKYNADDPIYNLGQSSDPVQFSRALEWKVEGKRIVVYPSLPLAWLDVGHYHSGAHVAANQVHAQGPSFGYATNSALGSRQGGSLYSLEGSKTGCGYSRITEKVDFVNNEDDEISIRVVGLGYKPNPASPGSPEVPNLSGVTVTGTAMLYTQGKTGSPSIHDPAAGYGPVKVFKAVSFTGFNPLVYNSFKLAAGARLTMITELNAQLPIKPSKCPTRVIRLP